MHRQTFILLSLALLALCVYLFVTAPAPLTEASRGGKEVPIEVLMEMVNAENATARTIYTREIVGAGQKAGLAFGENWREPDVEAGPLPALVLRETAGVLERDPVELGLFLGSDFPIAASNLFAGRQQEMFQKIRDTKEPQYFYAEDIQQYTAMFPDYASAEACVTCHNEHEKSPKKDWVLNDIMGATTWTYPRETVTVEEMTQVLGALRRAFREAYGAYITKATGFSKPPEIGDKWPRDGYFLPSPDVFITEVVNRSSAHTVDAFLKAVETEGTAAPAAK
jgi:adenylate cyclase